MTALGYDMHEKELDKFVKELEQEGYRVVKLNGKSPDGVAARVVDGKIEISAVEALGSQYYKGKGWQKQFTYKKKREVYSMFDKVLIHVFKRDPNVSKSSYCNFRRCRVTEIEKVEVFDNEIYFCDHHRDLFLAVPLVAKTEFVYWCIDNLKKSIVRVLDKS